jgi:hypothetical protein
MINTEIITVNEFSLSIVQEEFLKELKSGLLFEKLTDILSSPLIGSDVNSILQISMVYSLDLGEFLFLKKSHLKQRIDFLDENSLHIYDDYLLIIDEICHTDPTDGIDTIALNSAIKDYSNNKDKTLLSSIIQENYSKSLTEKFFESILNLQTKLDDFVKATDVTAGHIPFRMLNEESAGLFVEYLFHDKTRETFNINSKFYSEEGIRKFNFFKEKLLKEIIKEETKDLFSIFKPKYFLMFYQKDGISLSRFFELFNNLIEEDLDSFHYLFNNDSDLFGTSLSKIEKVENNNLKELKDDELVRTFKNLERINSLKKTNLDFIVVSNHFYSEIVSRKIKLENYSDFKVSFWFLIFKLFFPSHGINNLKKIPILLYKTDVLSVLERLSIGTKKEKVEDYSPDELSEGGIETLSYLKDDGFEFKVPNEFYNNLRMFSELMDNGFSATETGSYEFIAKRLLELFQAE